jgi:two-component system, cell cycle sensor histidine kinase and response regulator CckA
MPELSKLLSWVGIPAAALVGALLHAVSPAAGFAFAGVLLLAVIASALLARSEPDFIPLPPPQPNPVSFPELPPGVNTLILSASRLRLLESAVVHAHDSIVILEAEPRQRLGRAVLYVNDAFCKMSGYSRDEVVGRSLHLLRGPDSDTGTLEAIREALADCRPLRVELRNYRKDGTAFWVDLSLVPVPDGSGVTAHWVMIQRDITQGREASEALRRSEAMFRGIFENTSAGVSLTDATGRFVSCNPAFAAMTGRTVDEILELNPADITHPEDFALQSPLMVELREGKRDRFSIPKRYVRPDGKVVWAEVSIVAVRGPGGAFECGLGVSLNVTERRLLEDQLRQAQKMEAVGQMAGGVAHDFNNLLTAVLCNLALIELPEDHPNRPHLSAIEKAATRAADLTGKLLGYARRNQLVFSPIDPSDAFAETVGLLRHTLDPRIRLVVRVSALCDPVQADPTLLSQALLNLCLNSRDAMPDGGTLTLSAEPVELTDTDTACTTGEGRAGRFIRLSVTDTGTGMTDEVKTHLFEPFFTTKGIGKGTGLGLPMVQGIVKQHQGWVTCASVPGAGTRIDLHLPPADADAAQRPVLRSLPMVPSAERTPLPRVGMVDPPTPGNESNRTILLVDDEPMIREIGRLVLQQAGFRVLTAEDGVEAVDVFRREYAQIDLVVLDVTMPRMSGRDAFRHLVEFDPGVKVLFSTGYSAEDIAELDGAVGLLGKPYRPHELLTAVNAAFDGEPTPA